MSWNPLFSSVSSPQTVLQPDSKREAGDQIPLLQAPKKGQPKGRQLQEEPTVWQLKHKKKNNTQKTLEAEESIAKAEEEQEKQEEEEEEEEEEEGHQEEKEENKKTEEAESQKRAF